MAIASATRQLRLEHGRRTSPRGARALRLSSLPWTSWPSSRSASPAPSGASLSSAPRSTRRSLRGSTTVPAAATGRLRLGDPGRALFPTPSRWERDRRWGSHRSADGRRWWPPRGERSRGSRCTGCSAARRWCSSTCARGRPPLDAARTEVAHALTASLDDGYLPALYITSGEGKPGGCGGHRRGRLGRRARSAQEPLIHHDFVRRRNGNTVLLVWDRVSPSGRASSARRGVTHLRALDPGKNPGDVVREISSSGETVWGVACRGSSSTPRPTSCAPSTSSTSGRTPTCRRRAPNGDFVVSFRLIDTIAIVDRATGALRWKWGRGVLGHQHDATVLESGNSSCSTTRGTRRGSSTPRASSRSTRRRAR